MSVLNKIKKSLWKFDINIDRFSSNKNYLYRRQKIIKYYGIDSILDVGANVGQYASELRQLNYKGDILSFEPLAAEFKILQSKALRDAKWKTFNYALGSKNKNEKINISENSFSSSILELLPAHIENAPESKSKDIQTIQVKTLDSIFDNILSSKNNIYLKIDTQGYEKEVLTGAFDSLKKISCLQLEMSLIPLYSTESSFEDLMKLLTDQFKLIGFERDSQQETGELNDGIFIKKIDEKYIN